MSVLLFLVLLLRGDASAGDSVLQTRRGCSQTYPPAFRSVSATVDIQKGLAGAESIFAQLDEEPESDA